MMNKVDFQQDAPIQTNGHDLIMTDQMQENLNIIIQFANSVSAVIKNFAELCREHSKKMQQARPEFEEVRNQLIRERKKRLELEDIIRQRVSGAHSDQLLTDTPATQEERKRPKNAFTLFVTDQRDKILKEHPSLDLYKITTLAAIKWKKLSRQQQLVYQKKLQEMTKITRRQQIESRNKMQGNSDGYYVKKEFGCENEENYNYAHQNEERQQQKKNGEQQNTINNNIHPTFAHNQEENPITGTLAFEEQKLNEEHRPREKGVIQNMLDLFHTQVEQSYRNEQSVNPIQNPSNQIEQVNIQPIAVNSEVVVEPSPSLQILQAATQNDPIVIPPTIQQ